MIQYTGRQIKEELIKHGRPAVDLANFMGLTPSAMSKFISGINKMRKKDIICINYYFNLLEAKNPDTSIQVQIMQNDSMLPIIPKGYSVKMIKSSVENNISKIYCIELKNELYVYGRVRIKHNMITIMPENGQHNDVTLDMDDIKATYVVIGVSYDF